MAENLFAGLSPAARQALLDMGPLWSSDISRYRKAVLDIYTPVLAARRNDGVAVFRDQPYGIHPRQRLDVFQPALKPGQADGVPVVMFVHGGAFVRGDMNSNQEIYGNVLQYFANNGMLGINVEYRLAPEASFPGGSQDIAAAVDWVRAHAAQYGGNPDHIILIGHSAGGAHAASYVADPRVRPVQGPAISGLVLISARLRADMLPDNPNAAGVKAYWGADAAVHEKVSPLNHAENVDVPLMIAIAEYENPYLDVYAAEFFARVSRVKGYAPRFVQLMKHNHTSIVAHFNTGEAVLGRQIRDFIATTSAIAGR
ncbi:alpha/beta hydrolase [Collimonas antrihumi]|uniref:alpha/beta hydrolase n=1 Tax=Collimonas antrihumi TaxID=1940615 RepID=UPI001B8B9A98|nr:alpha/beta hydrolase [Collimonas antrihumi]